MVNINISPIHQVCVVFSRMQLMHTTKSEERPCLDAVFYLGAGRTDSTPHSANQCMCCLEQIHLMSWPQFTWVRKKDMVPQGLCSLPAMTFSASLISSSGNLHYSREHGTTRNMYTWDCQTRQHIRKLTCTTHIPLSVTAFLRNGNQAQGFAVEPKSIRRACAWNINQLVHEISKTDGRVLTCNTEVPLLPSRSCSSFIWSIFLLGN